MKLKPKCFTKNMQVALTNRGELIPCCYCDEEEVLNYPTMKKLLKVSKISEVESIEEILLTKEWIDFANDLKNNKGPQKCFDICREKSENSKEEFYIEDEKIIHVHKI